MTNLKNHYCIIQFFIKKQHNSKLWITRVSKANEDPEH